MHKPDIDITHETARFRWNRFSATFASEIRRSRARAIRFFPHLRWYLNEVVVKINGMKYQLRRAAALNEGGQPCAA
ncbi:MAG: hypothetical protein O9342_00405 [Beijerinckiaceae bacterium]|nr:hypothetical protein [Beijerinckiaceae bacterium]